MGMGNNFLSQEEINALLAGEDLASTGAESADTSAGDNKIDTEAISDIDKDLLGEIGNISMGSASTALYQLINQQVNITTPVVSVTTLKEIKEGFETPNIVLDIEYIAGIIGRNILIIKTLDGLVISNLMMGGDGNVTETHDLSEIEISAVSEAMNQMIGSAATSMATMFGRKVDISPPSAKIVVDGSIPISDAIPEDQPIVRVSFRMTIGDIVDSNIMQIFPIETAKNIVAIMTGEDKEKEVAASEPEKDNKKDAIVNKEIYEQPAQVQQQPQQQYQPEPQYQQQYQQPQYEQPRMQQPVEVHAATFEPLVPQNSVPPIKNIDLILDVPLDISVVLGRTKKSIQDILNLGTGSLIELDKLAEEPVEILVNGKQIALGEVVVVDENFGIRITNIVSSVERIKRLK
ncbi:MULTISPECIES: flagellar motor switch phosphatase FliY [Clostridium]|uniref:Flagellar motor switch protein FliN n=1 Tax=Clostridium beijerinckii TaxID=1520 RepID=A0A1S8RU54_CLOBE|nr:MULTISPECIES: flagellar motor switch phosphatase FliY [Clostridium]MBN7573084.1 flagellar motor switch phosphatase FliY [Clostridium beijerinckii]MBN7578423.1 flagellar motor switch phosphatase FliY [Clostridium beijerinckii]MBN7582858.1 flagellar motor switch phosphatase FliY [Clostridium beijerinckii]MBO0519023.1 flagellar motor switch phosphatase FliY [Clostridium beijerinckii]OOM56741.1 flagellar motor switch protein FliN [Clostridium beijerinckii]